MSQTESHVSSVQLSSYLDGELDEALQRKVDEHVVDCAACGARLERLLAGKMALQSLRPVETKLTWREPESVPPRSRRAIRRVVRRRTAVAAGVLALAMLTVFTWPGTRRAVDTPSGANDLTRAALDVGLYLSDVDHPVGPSRFEAAYQLRPASVVEAVRSAGTVSGPLERMPDTYGVRDSQIIEHRGSAAAARISYDGPAGEVVVFCQPRDRPVIYTGFDPVAATIGSTACTSVYCSRVRAVTFVEQAGRYTVVGPRGSSTFDLLLEELVASP